MRLKISWTRKNSAPTSSMNIVCAVVLIAVAALTICYQTKKMISGFRFSSNHVSKIGSIEKLIVASNFDVANFGWITASQIYYGIGENPSLYNAEPVTDSNETAWYAYDLKDQQTTRIASPYPRLKSKTIQELEYGETVNLLYMTTSPTTDKVIYTRLPDNYQRPNPLPHDYFDPAEIWVTESLNGGQDERTTFPLLNDTERLYDCGFALSAESRWFADETIVLGSCYFPYGITTAHYLADLANQSIQFLNFEDESGEYVPTEEIAVAHNSPSLAFSTSQGFWVIPVENTAREIPLKLSELNVLFNDRPAAAAAWSADDQWIYYWTFSSPTKYDENGFVEYQPWWLEKINIATKERIVVLSENDLLSLLGYDMYRRHIPDGRGNPWKLSSDETSILLFLNETVDTTSSLFLISW